MAKISGKDSEKSQRNLLRDKHFMDIKRKNIIRLSVTYILPLILLIMFFQYQFNNLLTESRELHIKAIAENQANLLDLFLRERVVNLTNLIDDPKLEAPPSTKYMLKYLQSLYSDSHAFIDIGFFDTTGIQIAYAGPQGSLEKKDYSQEPWYRKLKQADTRHVITDIYPGLRNEPHFTIAVCRNLSMVMKSSLDPQKIYHYMISAEQAKDVFISIINKKGQYQLVSDEENKVMEYASLVPPTDGKTGIATGMFNGQKETFAYSWLNETDWAVVIRNRGAQNIWAMQSEMIIIACAIIIILIIIIYFRSVKMAQMQIEKDITRSQLEHASKLASVGELAGGIAHEINNPLAIIASETGLIKDIMDPEFGLANSFDELVPHLDNINEATFRCRDITRKLLSFVRQSDIEIQQVNINELLDDLVNGFYERELSVSNIIIEMDMQKNLPLITTDSNQLRQVVLNIINNAIDAIDPPGKIVVTTTNTVDNIEIIVSDNGKGIREEDIHKIFMPFFTTKEVGKGTGLGLSVSYSIIKNLGGDIDVESIYRKGTTFTIKMPHNLVTG